MSTFEIIL